MKTWRDRLRSRALRNAAIALYILCVAGLIAAYLSVSLSRVKYAVFMRADATIYADEVATARGVVLDPRLGQPFRRGEVLLGLGARTQADGAPAREPDARAETEAAFLADTPHVWARARMEPGGYFQVSAALPASVTPGKYDLRMRAAVRDERGGQRVEETFELTVPVTVSADARPDAPWPPATRRLAPDPRTAHLEPVELSEGPIEIDILSADAEIPRGLPTVVYLRTRLRESGAPVSTRVYFDESKGMTAQALPADLQTDHLGLARLELTAATDLLWTLRAGDAAESAPEKPADDAPAQPITSQAKLRITTAPSQFSLQLNHVLARPNTSVSGHVTSLYRHGGVMVDLYQHDAWLSADAFGLDLDVSAVPVQIPENHSKTDEFSTKSAQNAQNIESENQNQPDRAANGLQIYRVQVYRSVYGTRHAWDIDYLVGAPDDRLQDYQRAAHALAAHLAAHTQDPYFRWLAEQNPFAHSVSKRELYTWIDALLTALPRHFSLAPALIDTRLSGQHDLDARIQRTQARLRTLTQFTLLVGLLIVVYFAMVGMAGYRRQQRLLQDVELELALEAHDDTAAHAPHDRWERWVVSVQVVIALATFFLFGLGVLMLLSYF